MTMIDEQQPGHTSVESLVASICAAHGVRALQTLRSGSKRDGLLRLVIESDPPVVDEAPMYRSGVTVDVCRRVSRDLSAALEVHADSIPTPARLEVSSPGVERPLFEWNDYVRFTGFPISLRLRLPDGTHQTVKGTLTATRDHGQHLHVLPDVGRNAAGSKKGVKAGASKRKTSKSNQGAGITKDTGKKALPFPAAAAPLADAPVVMETRAGEVPPACKTAEAEPSTSSHEEANTLMVCFADIQHAHLRFL